MLDRKLLSWLGALIRALQTLVTRTTVLVSGGRALPEIAQAVLRPQFERLEVEFKQMLAPLPNAFVKVIAGASCQASMVH